MAVLLFLVAPTGADVRAADPLLFRLTDPRGDDHGAGALTYPLRDDLGPGSLDLLGLSSKALGDATEFTATFARPIAGPTGRVADLSASPLESIARLGFYTLNLDLYVDLDRVAGSGQTRMLPGRGAWVDSSYAWEKAVCLTPCPQEARRELRRRLLEEARIRRTAEAGRTDAGEEDSLTASVERELAGRYFFPTLVRVRGRTITFQVPNSFWGTPSGDAAHPTWGFTVVVTGADPVERIALPEVLGRGRGERGLFTIPVSERGSAESFGCGAKGDTLFPAIVDLLQPQAGVQESELRNYDLRTGRRAAVTGVIPAEAAANPR